MQRELISVKEKLTLQTVDRALELIEILARSSDKMSVVEISKALGIARTAVYSLLNSLMARNFIEKDPVTNKYFLGYKFVELGTYYRYQYPFIFSAERGIYALSRKWPHQINLSILKPGCVLLFLVIKAPESTPRTTHRSVLPAYTSASGKLLLAHLSPQELAATLDSVELKKYAKNTIVNRQELMDNLEEIRRLGYSLEQEESVNQRSCVAAPIRDVSGTVIATISMTMPMADYQNNLEQCIEDVMNAGQSISMELGYNPYQV